MRSRPGWIPQTHDNCKDNPCIRCQAVEHLLPEDWELIDLAALLMDQGAMQNPMASDDVSGYAPRLEAWVAVLDVVGIPKFEQLEIIRTLRYLFDLFHDKARESGVHNMAIEDLRPVEV